MKKIIFVSLSRISFALFSVLLLASLGHYLEIDDFAIFAYIDSIKLLLCASPIIALSQAYIKDYRFNNYSITSLYVSLKLLSVYILIFTVIFLVFSLGYKVLVGNLNDSSNIIISLYFFLLSNIFYLYIRGVLVSVRNELYLLIYELVLLLSLIYILLFMSVETWTLNNWLNAISIFMLLPVGLFVIYFKKIMEIDVENGPTVCYKNSIKYQLKYLRYSLINNISANIFSIADSFIVGSMLGSISLANYKAVKIIISGFNVVGDMINTLIFPKFSVFHFNGDNGKKEIIKLTPWMIVFAFIALLIVNVFGFDSLSLIYSGKYDNKEVRDLIVYISIWGFLFILTRTYASYIGAIGLPEVLMKTTIISGAISVSSMFFLVESFEYAGLGIALIISALMPAIFVVLFSRRHIISHPKV